MSIAPERPWLRNPAWAAGIIVCPRPIRTGIWLASCLVCGSIVLLLLVSPMRLETLALSASMALVLWVVTHQWLRGVRQEESLCRLRTLPAFLGGWFKAEVECSLPERPAGPLRVRLRNLRGAHEDAVELWRTVQVPPPVPAPVPGTNRSVLSVSLQLSRGARQLPIPVRRGWFEDDIHWILDVYQDCPGVSFYVSFEVPVYEAADTGIDVPAGPPG